MKMYNTKQVTKDLHWVGANDRRISLFEGVYDVPLGVSYNSYILLDDKTVLLDTVDKAVAHQFFENIAHVLNGRNLDYLIINHMEPDHCAEIENIINKYPDVKIVCNAKTQSMISQFFDFEFPQEQYVIVKEGDTLETGHHTLTFVMAPMVHWPEVMVTYDATDKILFSADAFGSFGAIDGNIFADEVDFEHRYMDEARRYAREAYDNRKFAFVTDVVRLYAIYTEGGIYMDTDVEVIKPLDPFLKHIAFSGYENDTLVPTGIMASEKGAKWAKDNLDYYNGRHFVKEDGSFDITTNVITISNYMLKYGLRQDNTYQDFPGLCTMYPKDFFCPKSYHDFKIYKTKNTVTIHHFAGSWLPKDVKEKHSKQTFWRRHPYLHKLYRWCYLKPRHFAGNLYHAIIK